jgi:serine phosphatase RsbU (regulator of sigma subunit)/HAMP domain-containing protein
MKLRFSIASKISIGFGVFILAVGAFILITNGTLKTSRELNNKINGVYTPSTRALEVLRNQLLEGQYLIHHWAYNQSLDSAAERQQLRVLMKREVPRQIQIIDSISSNWSESEIAVQKKLTLLIDTLYVHYKYVMDMLPNFESYMEPFAPMLAQYPLTANEAIPSTFEEISSTLEGLYSAQAHKMQTQVLEMNDSFNTLRTLLITLSLAVILISIAIAIFTTRSIVRPLQLLKQKLANLSLGIYSVHPAKAGNDEIGDMAAAFNKLVTNFERTKEFSTNIGSGNFDMDYDPLSEHDEMGKALLRMKDDLHSYRNEMEQKVATQTIEIRKQRDEVELQKERVTELYQDLKSSIDYAQRLQETILPDDEFIRNMFPDSFVFFRPKATVSGDFYWFKQQGNRKIFAAADCTGHGVPGAFMSLVGHNVLNQVTKVFTRPDQILNNLNKLAAEVMRADRSGEGYMRDGMDIVVCSLDEKNLTLEFSGAHNPVYIVRDGQLIETDCDPFSIGSFVNGEKEFTNHKLQLLKGDCLYLFSDGYMDQFGGPKGKKFLRKQFRMLLLQVNHLPMAEQKWRMAETLDRWQSHHEQVDDILVMGIRI